MIDVDGVLRPDVISIQEIINQHVQEFIENGKQIGEEGLSIGSGGNLSVRIPGGILITSTGSELCNLQSEDIIFVSEADENKIYYVGSKKPSSETINHWVIYKNRKDIMAISHVNVGSKEDKHLLTTKKEFPYGTVELGNDAAKLLRKVDIIMLKKHGLIAVGNSLLQATNLLIESADNKKTYSFAPMMIIKNDQTKK